MNDLECISAEQTTLSKMADVISWSLEILKALTASSNPSWVQDYLVFNLLKQNGAMTCKAIGHIDVRSVMSPITYRLPITRRPVDRIQ